MKENNPFTLTFGRQPLKYISRDKESTDIISGFTAEPPVFQTCLISGIRGSGKTVLMTSVAKELDKTGSWITVDLNSAVDLLDDFAMRLEDSCRSIPNLIDTGFEISFAGFGFGVSGQPERDSVSKIAAILQHLKKKGKRVLITIDEVSNSKNMRVFASQLQIFIRQELPVFLIMTGLYENIYAIQNDSALTFLLRSPKLFLEPLSLRQISKQYREIFNIESSVSNKLAAITRGYAFAFQALGMLYFEYGDSRDLNAIISRLDDILDDYVYKKIWESLSRNDKQIVSLLSGRGRLKTSEICSALSMTSQSFSKYRERLLNKGIICAPERGYTELALPRFGEITSEYIDTNE